METLDEMFRWPSRKAVASPGSGQPSPSAPSAFSAARGPAPSRFCRPQGLLFRRAVDSLLFLQLLPESSSEQNTCFIRGPQGPLLDTPMMPTGLGSWVGSRTTDGETESSRGSDLGSRPRPEQAPRSWCWADHGGACPRARAPTAPSCPGLTLARCAHSHGAPTEAADPLVELLQQGELGRARSPGQRRSGASPC